MKLKGVIVEFSYSSVGSMINQHDKKKFLCPSAVPLFLINRSMNMPKSVKDVYTPGHRLTTYAIYDRPHLRPQKLNFF
jgi:hypothetical protein